MTSSTCTYARNTLPFRAIVQAEVGFAELAKDNFFERWRGFAISSFRSVRTISGFTTALII
jgi:hypothetical protein